MAFFAVQGVLPAVLHERKKLQARLSFLTVCSSVDAFMSCYFHTFTACNQAVIRTDTLVTLQANLGPQLNTQQRKALFS